jgi:hypothetical protein
MPLSAVTVGAVASLLSFAMADKGSRASRMIGIQGRRMGAM